MKLKINYKRSGFTLIELLVVIAIIGLLSSITLVYFNNARKSARDTKRKADIKQINTAIQLYIQDNGHAPYLYTTNPCSANAGITGAGTGGNCTAYDYDPVSWDAFKSQLSAYASNIKGDPCGTKCKSDGPPYYVYGYNAPYVIGQGCAATGNGFPSCTKGVANMNLLYQLFAETLEKDGNIFGYDSSGFGSF